MNIWTLAIGFIFFSNLIVAPAAQANPIKLNAMCFAENDHEPQPFEPQSTEENIKEKFRIASLSKILTSHWAVIKLGPGYRFTTSFSVIKGNANDSCQIHMSGELDPYFGKDILNKAWSQMPAKLQSLNCKRIEKVGIGEGIIYKSDLYSYRKLPKNAWHDPEEYIQSQGSMIGLKNYFSLNSYLKISTAKVQTESEADFFAALDFSKVKKYSFKSMPLFMMLKDFNKVSYNYPPEVLFEKLGGAQAYSQFIYERLNLNQDEVEVNNGSGYPIYIAGVKRYNKVSCAALVRIIRDLEYAIKVMSQDRLQLADVMGVGGDNETYTTFGKYSSAEYENRLVAKTGTADQAITFGGMFSIAGGGRVYFSVLTSPLHGYQNPARSKIKTLVDSLMSNYKLEAFEYQASGYMLSFDEQATLVEGDGQS